MSQYREVYIRGEGAEIVHHSDRNRPRVNFNEPIYIHNFCLKDVQLPLTFSPLTEATDYQVITTYTSDLGNTAAFTDYLTFTADEIVTADLIASKMQAVFVIHASDTLTNLDATYPGSLLTYTMNAGTQLGATPTMTVGASTGIPLITMTEAFATVVADATLVSATVDVVRQSLLADLFDFDHWGTNAIMNVDQISGGSVTSDLDLPMRTRPDYLYLHSNIGLGLSHHSTSYPSRSQETVIAKIPVVMDSTQVFGESSQLWQNPSAAHPGLFFRAGENKYTHIEFYLTYPNGYKARFSNKSFSLTLSLLIDEDRTYL